MAITYPNSCKAHHVNLAIPAEPTLSSHPALYAQVQATPLTEWEKAGIARTEWFGREGTGYSAVQRSKPATVGFALAASPVALLAWIYDKLHDWTDEYPWTDDEILTWVSVYEFSTAGCWATLRIYFDDGHQTPASFFAAGAQEYSTGSQLGVSRFPKELLLRPKLWHHTMGPLVLIKEHNKGGHFAAWEVPELLVGDLREMFGRDGGAFGCISGKDGYDEREASHL